MPRVLALAVAVMLIGAAPGAGQPRAGLGILRGQVTDSAFEPVRLAEIAILGTSLRVTADTLGLFRIDGVPVGVHPIVARAIGWKPLFFMIRMEADQEQIVRVGLERAVQRLPDLVVKGGRHAKPPEYAFTTRYDDFFRRRVIRWGTFRTRSDVWFRSAFNTVDLLRAIPGVYVRTSGAMPVVEFASCATSGGQVSVWIDGARVVTRDHNEALSYLRPNDIEMIEVYRRAGQIPGEFMGDSCAAVVIWTR
ncbi:MAG: carboxypeptidase regulatory-like domain-containing protein [Gemmatimonadales bacterium]